MGFKPPHAVNPIKMYNHSYIPIESEFKITYIYDWKYFVKINFKKCYKIQNWRLFPHEFKRSLLISIPGSFSDSVELYMKSTKIWMWDVMYRWNSHPK